MRCRTLLALLAVFGACEADHTLGAVEPDAGYNQAVTGTDIRPSISLDSPAFLADGNMPTLSQTLDAQGVDMEPLGPLGPVESWTGWVENYQFKSGSDAIKISFASDPSGQLVGHVDFGNAPPLAPPTDPNLGYPPDFYQWGYPEVVEGFSYSMVLGSISSIRLRFSVKAYELWTEWCAIQTPIPGSSACIPAWQSATETGRGTGYTCTLTLKTGATIPIDCGKLELCSMMMNVCVCSTTCSLNLAQSETVSFDLAVSGDIASGSMGLDTGSHNVHFTKDP